VTVPEQVKVRLQLEAARQFLVGVWPLLNSLETSPQVTPGAQRLITDAKRELEPLYLKAMGDAP
jgi:hypothetical protein